MTGDACGYGTGTDADILACDYGGMFPTHYCRSWPRRFSPVDVLGRRWLPDDTLDRLDRARSVAELAHEWEGLRQLGVVEGFGGEHWHHAVSHLRYQLDAEREITELTEGGA